MFYPFVYPFRPALSDLFRTTGELQNQVEELQRRLSDIPAAQVRLNLEIRFEREPWVRESEHYFHYEGTELPN